jgi:hypothetical protein
MQKVSGRTVGTTATDSESALPAEVQRRLGELIEAASGGSDHKSAKSNAKR